MEHNKVETDFLNDVFTITLNYPKKSNAYDQMMCFEIQKAFQSANLSGAKLILLKAEGKNFCAGADLQWMKRAQFLSDAENLDDMSAIKNMFQAILTTKPPIIGLIQGAVRGGGVGLVAACDIVFADQSVSFSLSESKWGLIPGIITPLVIQKIGASTFLELAVSSRIFDFNEALNLKLIHHHASKLGPYTELIKSNSIDSNIKIKSMIQKHYLKTEFLDEILKISSEMRKSEEFKIRSKQFSDS